MADPVTWQTVAQSVLPGAVGGFIGAGSALYGAKRAGDRDRQARAEQAARERVQRREDALIQSLGKLIDAHTATLGPAVRARRARQKSVTDADWEEADDAFGVVHIAAVRSQEALRILSRSDAVEESLEELRNLQADVYEVANGNAPKGLSPSSASRKMRVLMRKVADAVKAECDEHWSALPAGGKKLKG